MKNIVPDYYNKFKCIAGKCTHSCCIGWEIDIDEKTYNLYINTEGKIGQKAKRYIKKENDVYSFILDENDRCPFLNESNLCEIIIEKGENYLCEICREHPRFHNCFSSCTETGLGLSCEAVAKLIINKTDKTFIGHEVSGNEMESKFFKLRSKVFSILQDRSIPVFLRINMLEKKFKLNMFYNKKQIIHFLLGLEHMEDKWVNMLYKWQNTATSDIRLFNIERFDIIYEQLLIYFIYRHLSDCIYDNLFCERLSFCILCSNIIMNLINVSFLNNGVISLNECINIAKIFSSEIEYSEENTDKLLNYICIKH